MNYIKINGVMVPAPLDDSKFEDASVEEVSSDLPISKPGSIAESYYTVPKEVADISKKYNISLGKNFDETELEKYLAASQRWYEQLYRGTMQLVVNEVGLGTILGLSDLIDYMINIGKAYGEDDWTNPLSSKITEWQDSLRERWQIYRENPDKSWQISDSGWWFDNGVQIGSTLSLMIPAAGWVKALGMVGKVTKFDRLFSRASYGLGRFFNKIEAGIKGSEKSKGAFAWSRDIQALGKSAHRAVVSRQMEDMLEGREVYNQTYDEMYNNLTNMTEDEKENFFKVNPNFVGKSYEEIARYVADKSAQYTFEKDFLWVLTDFLAWKSIGSGYLSRTANRTLDKALASELNKMANSAGIQAERVMAAKGINEANKSWLRWFATNPSRSVPRLLTSLSVDEGVEEFGQGVYQEQGKEVMYKYLNPYYTQRSLASYLSDGKLWEQAFWGALGGIAFGAGYKGVHHIADKIELARNKEDITKADILNLQTNEERLRADNFASWTDELNRFKARVELYRQGYNPYSLVKDTTPEGTTVWRKAKEGEHVGLTEEEKETVGYQLIDDFINNLAYRAVDNGNIDYLKALIEDDIFDEAIKKIGGGAINFDMQQRMMTKLNEAVDNYAQALYDVFLNGNTKSEEVGRAVARNIARNKYRITELNETIKRLDHKINNASDATTNVIESQTIYFLQKQLDNLEDEEKSLDEAFDNGKINKTFYDNKKREIDRIKFAYLSKFNNYVTRSYVKELEDGKTETIERYKPIFELSELNYHDLYNELYNLNSTIEYGWDVGDKTKELIFERLDAEFMKAKTESMIPTSKRELQEAIDDMEASFGDIIKNRLNQAEDDIINYIKNSDNPSQTLTNLMNDDPYDNEDKKILNKFRMFKIGHDAYEVYATRFRAAAGEEEQVRRATIRQNPPTQTNTNTNTNVDEEEEEDNNDNNNTNENTEDDEKPVEEDNEETETQEDTTNELEGEMYDSPTGEQEIGEDEYMAYAENISEDEEEIYDDQLLPEAYELHKQKIAVEVFDNLKKRLTEGFELKSFLSGIYSKYFKQIYEEELAAAINKYKDTGMSNAEIAQGVAQGLQNFLSALANKAKRQTNTTENAITQAAYNLFDVISQVNYDEYGNMIMKELVSSEDIDNNIEEIKKEIENFLDEYIKSKEIPKNRNGKYIINGRKIFEYLVSQDPELAKRIFNTLCNYLMNYKGDKYAITDKNLLKEYYTHPNLFINKLNYENASVEQGSGETAIKVGEQNYFHAAYSTTMGFLDRKLKTLKKEIDDLKEKYKSNVSFNGISWHYDNDIAAEIKLKIEEYNKLATKYNTLYKNRLIFESGADGVKVIYIINSKSNSISIRVVPPGTDIEQVKSDDTYEIGYMGLVETNPTHTSYKLVESKSAKGIRFKTTYEKGILTSNMDEFFNKLITALFGETTTLTEDDIKFAKLIDNSDEHLKEEEYKKSLKENFGFIKDYLKSYIAAEDIILNNEYDLYYFAEQIKRILHYQDSESINDYRLSYMQWVARVHDNYTATYKIMQAYKEGKEVTGEPISSGIETVELTKEYTANLNTINANTTKLVYINENGDIVFGNSNESTNNFAGMKKFSIGFALTKNSVGYGIAWVTKTSKLDSNQRLAKLMEQQLTDIISGEILKDGAVDIDYIIQHCKWLFGKSSLFYGVKESVLREKLAKLATLKQNSKEEATEFSKELISQIVNTLKFNKSFYFAKNTASDVSYNGNPYFYFKSGKLYLDFSINGQHTTETYNDYCDFAIKNGAFILNQAVEQNADENGPLPTDIYVSYEVRDYTPVEGEDNVIETGGTINDFILKHKKGKPISTTALLKKLGATDEEIKLLTEDFISYDNEVDKLIPESIIYTSSKSSKEEGYMYFDKIDKKIYLTSKGREALKSGTGLKTFIRWITHENTHKRFDELNPIDKKYIIEELNELIKEFYDYFKNDKSKAAEDIRTAFSDKNHLLNEENIKKYIAFLETSSKDTEAGGHIQEKMISEWICETLTQPNFIDYLSKIEAKEFESKEQTKKSLFQKFIDLILDFFNISLEVTKNNSIFAKQYEILFGAEKNEKTSEKVVPVEPVDKTTAKQLKVDKNGQFEINFDNAEESNETKEKIDETKEDITNVETSEEKNDNVNNDTTDDTNDDIDIELFAGVNENEEINTESNEESNPVEEDSIDDFMEYVSSSDIGGYIESRTVRNSSKVESNIYNTIMIPNMEDFVEMFKHDDKVNIANLIKNGNLIFTCI